MKIHKLALSKIQFTYQSYSQELKDSVVRIGLSFPIKVTIKNNQYYCLDGHKRLSVLQDIDENTFVNALIVNDGSTRSSDCWRGRNTH